MTGPLFVYGTLRDPDMLAVVLGRRVDAAAMRPAAAPGFVALHYPGRAYPALLRRPGGVAEGLVLMGLTPFERDLLDAFEGDEYRRTLIAVMVEAELHEAWAYLPVVSVAPQSPQWSLAHWQKVHKPGALAAGRATIGQLRAKLIAIRPH